MDGGELSWIKALAKILPEVRTQIQLVGFIVLVAGVVATRVAVPKSVTAQVAAGSIGLLFIVFGLILAKLDRFPPEQRMRLVLILFPTGCIFVLSLLSVAIWAAVSNPKSATISGIVVGEDEVPVPGAIISIDGIPEINDETPTNGNFSIPVPSNYQGRASYFVRARKGDLAGKQEVEHGAISDSVTIHLLHSQPPIKAGPPITTRSPLPSGNATLYNGFQFGDQSTFTFSSASIQPWGSPSDIGVATPPGTAIAQFFLPYDQPPYSDPQAKHHGVENAGIVDMGPTTLNAISEAPDSDYSFFYVQPEIGHVYCVRTRDGHHFAKIKITYIGEDRVAFDYVYQPSGSRSFQEA